MYGDQGSILHYSEKFITATPLAQTTHCAGGSLALAFATTRTLTVSAGGSYTVRVARASSCFGPPSAAVVVTPAPVPATPVIQQSAGGQLSVAVLANATYQWSNGPGGAILGATDATYPATGAAPVGTYTVVVTSAAGCASSPSAAVAVVLTVRGTLPAGWALYPNPADERLYLKLPPGGGPVQLTLLDALGRTVRATTTDHARTTLDVRGLPVGSYWLRAVRADGQAGSRAVQINH